MRPDAEKRLDRAAHAIHSAELLLAGAENDAAIGRAYYAMFYTAEAPLSERNLSYSKHSGVHAAFGQHFAKTGLLDPKFHGWLLTAFSRRIVGDYDMEPEVSSEEAQLMIERAREFLEAATHFLRGKGEPSTCPIR